MTVMLTIGVVSCVICVALWILFLLQKYLRRDMLVQLHHSDPPPWGLLDVYFVFLVFALVVPTATMAICFEKPRGTIEVEVEDQNEGPTTVQIPQDLSEKAFNDFAGGVVKISAVAIIIFYLVFRHQADFDDLGISPANLAEKIGMGVLGGFMLIPMAIGMVAALSLWWPYKHQTLDQLSQGSTTAGLLAVIFSVGIATPILEEVLFRGIVQGCLQRMAQLKNIDYWSAVLGGKVTQEKSDAKLADAKQLKTSSAPPLWPIFVSAAIFASMHIGHGPAPIPLYFLAIGLGYLYWRTNSIIPSIIIHIMLNTWSLVFIAMKTNS